nr:RNA-directed DNA polymerase, eukaryota, reverse transcriptase zinc-binding domain protein [Tanacetum cinerariifolium]
MEELDKSITTDEIRVAVWDYGENKSPSPDGYTFEFFRRFWNLIGPDFCSAVLCFFDHGFFPRDFPFFCGLKQGDPLAPILFILIMESLHISVSRAANDGVFKGLQIQGSLSLSHIFYADDAVVLKIRTPLSKWKVKTLSVSGRLTFLKSVLGAVPIYNVSIYKTPKGVLHEMEMLRNKFFNGTDVSESKITWVAWDKVLAFKKKGGLGVSSFFALNRALHLKWVWRFLFQDGSLWSHVICAIYGPRLESHSFCINSTWGSILRESQALASKGFDFLSHYKLRVGNGVNTNGDGAFRVKEVRSNLDDLFLPSSDV